MLLKLVEKTLQKLQQAGVRTLVMPNVAWVWVILGGQWPTRSTYDPTVPWGIAGCRTGA